jgi:hypothetical protein
MTKRDKQASEYAAEGRRVGEPCPHVRGTVTQYCSLNFTLTDEEREAIEFVVDSSRAAPHATLRKLLERTK